MQTLKEKTIANTRFGTISYKKEDLVIFPEGLIGFPEQKEYVLVSTSTESAFRWLQSTTESSLAFLITDPAIYVGDYKPLHTGSGQDQIYTTVNIPHGKPNEMSLNLAGPICVDPVSRKGKQIVLDNEAYTTRYRVFAEARQDRADVAA